MSATNIYKLIPVAFLVSIAMISYFLIKHSKPIVPSSNMCKTSQDCRNGWICKADGNCCQPLCLPGKCGQGSDGCGGSCECLKGQQCKNGNCCTPPDCSTGICGGDGSSTCGVVCQCGAISKCISGNCDYSDICNTDHKDVFSKWGKFCGKCEGKCSLTNARFLLSDVKGQPGALAPISGVLSCASCDGEKPDNVNISEDADYYEWVSKDGGKGVIKPGYFPKNTDGTSICSNYACETIEDCKRFGCNAKNCWNNQCV